MNDAEFKGLFIDSEALIWSTGDISQFKALQQLDISIQFDKNIVWSANFIFIIRKAAFIGLVNLYIQLGLVIFYIMPVNISFLLCPAEIDKLWAFFNNITSKVI